MPLHPQQSHVTPSDISTDRNYEIAAASLRGDNVSEIASRHGISRSHASQIIKTTPGW
ncbi:helix-turn-helix domain-containing protein [Neorhizobium huautlense]|uniref:helix-turn-helix domain-containing protein n=1 Tax=Neorhizobium huautlense TaxID=67774 RepID=UPI0035944F0A